MRCWVKTFVFISGFPCFVVGFDGVMGMGCVSGCLVKIRRIFFEGF